MLNNNKEIGNDKKGVKHKDTQRGVKEEHNYKEMQMTKRSKISTKVYK